MPDFDGLGPEVASKSENIASAVIDNKIYVVVGQTLHIYDVETDVWSSGSELPSYLKGPAACATSGVFAPKRLHVVGLGGHYVYDPATDIWASATPIPNSRYATELAVVDDVLYALGGGVTDIPDFPAAGFTSTNANEQYTPIGYVREFPSWLILPFSGMATLVAVAIAIRKKRSK
jgi:hypothetical protein